MRINVDEQFNKPAGMGLVRRVAGWARAAVQRVRGQKEATAQLELFPRPAPTAGFEGWARRYLKFAVPAAAVSLSLEPARAHAYLGEQLLNQAKTYFIAPLFVLSIVFAGVGALFNSNYARIAIYSAIVSAAVFTFINIAPTLMTAVQA